MSNALGERDIPFVLIGVSAVTVLLVTWLAAWYWALLAVAAIVGGGFLWSRVLGRADQPTPDLMSAEPGFMRGAGTAEEPYVLRSSRMVPPGGMVQSEEIIRIAHLVPGSLVRIRDANEDANLGRFSAVTAEGDAPPSLDLKADLEGNIAFRLVFNDSAQMTLEGGSCTFDGRVGREEVRVHWEAHLKEDRAYVEALAAFESNQVRRTGERASIMARYEADIAAAAESKDKDKLEAKARDARAESEEAIVEEERVERAALDEMMATSREAAAATAAEVEAEMDDLVEAAKAKQVEQELMLEEARAFEEAEAAAREEAKALKQAQKALKRAERQAEAEAAAAEAGEDEASEAARSTSWRRKPSAPTRKSALSARSLSRRMPNPTPMRLRPQKSLSPKPRPQRSRSPPRMSPRLNPRRRLNRSLRPKPRTSRPRKQRLRRLNRSLSQRSKPRSKPRTSRPRTQHLNRSLRTRPNPLRLPSTN